MLYGHSSALPKIAVGAGRGWPRRSWHPVSTGTRRYPWDRPGKSNGSCSRRPRVTVRRTCATGRSCSRFRHTACASGKCAPCSSTTSTGRRRRYAFAVPRPGASTCSRCRAASERPLHATSVTPDLIPKSGRSFSRSRRRPVPSAPPRYRASCEAACNAAASIARVAEHTRYATPSHSVYWTRDCRCRSRHTADAPPPETPLACLPSPHPSTCSSGRAGQDRGGTFTLAYGVATNGRAANVKTPITARAKLLVGHARTSACTASTPSATALIPEAEQTASRAKFPARQRSAPAPRTLRRVRSHQCLHGLAPTATAFILDARLSRLHQLFPARQRSGHRCEYS